MSKHLFLVLSIFSVCLSCLPQRAVDSESEQPLPAQLRSRTQASNSELETATFALG
jgi:hypothetical protein